MGPNGSLTIVIHGIRGFLRVTGLTEKTSMPASMLDDETCVLASALARSIYSPNRHGMRRYDLRFQPRSFTS